MADISIVKEAGGEFGQEGLPHKLIVIGDAAMVAGFRLAGVTEAYVAEGKAAERKLAELLDRENAGIVIASERVLGNAAKRFI